MQTLSITTNANCQMGKCIISTKQQLRTSYERWTVIGRKWIATNHITAQIQGPISGLFWQPVDNRNTIFFFNLKTSPWMTKGGKLLFVTMVQGYVCDTFIYIIYRLYKEYKPIFLFFASGNKIYYLFWNIFSFFSLVFLLDFNIF